MTTRVLALAMVASLGLAAPPTAGAQAPLDPARSPDVAFVAKTRDLAAADGELATVILARAKAPAVRAFAKRVIDARDAIVKELATLAGTRQIAVAPTPEALPAGAKDAVLSKVLVDLKAQPPRAFDAAALAALIASREAAVSLFETESRDGRDAELKEWAARQLPALREHLAAARAIRLRRGSPSS